MTDTNYRNPLRKRLKEGKSAYGLWVTMDTPAVSEIAAEIGMDWVCLDMEHSALSYKDVANHARAAKGSDMAVLVRVPATTIDATKRCLDMGVDGVLFPLISSADQLREAFSYARYPDAGIRGIGGERAIRWGMKMTEYLASANEETMVIPLIETIQASREFSSIIDVPGLETIFFGPADLSASCGYLGQWEGPGVADDILRMRKEAAAKNIASGIMAMDDPDVEARTEQGFKMVGLGSDFGLLIRAMKPSLLKLKEKAFDKRWF